MTLQRPFECPACGHDRIMQRPHELHTESGQLRVRLSKWVCGLCRYQWSIPARPSVGVDDWGRA